LSPLQHKLLCKHFQLGHLHIACIQDLTHHGVFGESNIKLASCDHSLCKACLHGQQPKCSVIHSTF
jgi:hypothetical protein